MVLGFGALKSGPAFIGKCIFVFWSDTGRRRERDEFSCNICSRGEDFWSFAVYVSWSQNVEISVWMNS